MNGTTSTARSFDRKNLAEEVATHMGHLIIDGELVPGQPLREQLLVDQLGVSRGTLRESLLILERQYLAVLLPGKGARVSPLDYHWVTEIHEVWYALFEILLVHISEYSSDEQRTALASAVSHLEASGLSREEFIAQAMALVDLLCQMHGDGVLTRQLRNLIPAARRCFRFAVLGDQSEIDDTRRFATEVTRAALEGDSERVRREVRGIAVAELARMRELLR